MIKRVVVTLDGSRNAEQAIPTAAGIARRAGGRLILFHVVDYRCLDYPFDTGYSKFLIESAQECAERYVTLLAQAVEKQWHVPTHPVIIEGDAAPTILEKVGSTAVDMLVMTTHGRGAIGRMWLGSVSDRVVRESSVPVLLLHTEDDPTKVRGDEPFKHILIPLDGSELSEQMLPFAAQIAEDSGACMTLLNVVQPTVLAALPVFTDDSAENAAAHADNGATIESARQYLANVHADYVWAVHEVHQTVIPATHAVADDVIKYSASAGADLIALSTHGHGGIKRMVLGSVADKVIRGSTVPVLTYRGQNAKSI